MSSPYFNFFNVNHAKVITGFGQTIIKFLANNTNEYLQNHYTKKFNVSPLKSTPCVLIDTDSNYYSVKELFELFGDGKSFLNYAMDLDKNVLEPLFKKMLDVFCQKYNIENRIKFVRDKIADCMFITEKKKYAIRMLAKEHKIYDKPKISITRNE